MGSPHDALFKHVFKNRDDAVGELQAALPADVLRHLDLDSLEPIDRSFVDPKLVQFHTDQLYSVPIDGRPGFVYVLFEHQSGTDRWMPLRILSYMVRIWSAYVDDNSGASSLPPIVPLILHHDEGPWRAAERMHDLFPSSIMETSGIARCTPSFRLVLDDLVKVTDEELRSRKLTTFGRLVLWALRDGRSKRLLETVSAYADYLGELLFDERRRVDAHTIFHYIYVVQGHATLDALIEAIPSPRIREEAMTIAEQLRQEGLKQGLQQGREQGREQGLQQGEVKGRMKGRREVLIRLMEIKFGELDAEMRRRMERADSAELDCMAERLLTAETLTEVLED